MNTRYLLLVIVMLVVGTALCWANPTPRVQTRLENTETDVQIIRNTDGTHRFRLDTHAGPQELTPEQFAARVYEEHGRRAWWMLFLNISSPIGIAWVVLGLGGQILFTGRMIVQWLVSERGGASIIPVSFWWMSLIGASMLLIYFVWRKDIVGVLGQSIGWVVYLRNLHLIYAAGGPGQAPPDVDSIETAEVSGRSS